MNIFVSLLKVEKACVIFIYVDFENLVFQEIRILLNQIIQRKLVSNFWFILGFFILEAFSQFIIFFICTSMNDFEKFEYLVIHYIYRVEPIAFDSFQNPIAENFVLKLDVFVFDQNKAHVNFREETWKPRLLLLWSIFNVLARLKVKKNLDFLHLHLMVQIFEKHYH